VPDVPEQALVTADQLARAYIDRAKAANTLRGYRADWRAFTGWCATHEQTALPCAVRTLGLYLADQAAAGVKTSTLKRRLSAISQAHQAAGHPSPTHDAAVRAVWAGIRRTHGTAPDRKAPLVTAQLRRAVAGLGDDLAGRRDRALLLLGFAGAFRRSELVALRVEDVAVVPEGLVVTLVRSKTDQEGAGRTVGIPYGPAPDVCPVRALTAWRSAAGISTGPLFRAVDRFGTVSPAALSDRSVARIVQRRAADVGLDPEKFGGHSLRAGLATSAAAAGVQERDIARQTGHKSMPVLRVYIREGELFRHNAAAAVFHAPP
jgi:site-specific recombinase XerD